MFFFEEYVKNKINKIEWWLFYLWYDGYSRLCDKRYDGLSILLCLFLKMIMVEV